MVFSWFSYIFSIKTYAFPMVFPWFSLQELKDKLQKRFGARCPAGALALARAAQGRHGKGMAPRGKPEDVEESVDSD